MSAQLSLRQTTSNGEKMLTSALNTLEKHGFLIKQEMKKSVFKDKRLAEKVGFTFEKIDYKEHPAVLTVYGFNKDLMLIIKARLYMLKELTIEKVREQKR